MNSNKITLILIAIIAGLSIYILFFTDDKSAELEALQKEQKELIKERDEYKQKSVDNYNLAEEAWRQSDSILVEFNKLSDVSEIRKRYEGDIRDVRSATIDELDSILRGQISDYEDYRR